MRDEGIYRGARGWELGEVLRGRRMGRFRGAGVWRGWGGEGEARGVQFGNPTLAKVAVQMLSLPAHYSARADQKGPRSYCLI